MNVHLSVVLSIARVRHKTRSQRLKNNELGYVSAAAGGKGRRRGGGEGGGGDYWPWRVECKTDEHAGQPSN